MSRSLPALDSITGCVLLGPRGSTLGELKFSSALLIGTWASSRLNTGQLLYTAEILQAVYYFSNFKDDGWRMKLSPSSSTPSLQWENTLAYIFTLYLTLVWIKDEKSDLAYLSKQNWPQPVSLSLSKAFWYSGIGVFRKRTRLGFGGLTVPRPQGPYQGQSLRNGCTNTETHFPESICSVWIVTQVSADLIIAAALVYEFQKAKSKFLEGRRRIHNTLDRLILLTIQTGSATAVIAVMAFITFLINNETNMCAGIMFPLGRVYVLSMLLNLNIRVSGNGGSSQGTSRTGTSGRDRGPIVFVHDTGTTHTDGLGGVRKSFLRIALFSTLTFCAKNPEAVFRQGSNGTFKSGSTRSHTAEDPPTEIEMMAIDSSKKQSELLV
ncbi:hypothetical protein DFH08DRAFT_824914 [Mycena albidolilacea]|uniref:DUF6534 domain-containing protein n=1 Tax=Mycena albidolilacea TaxID=1033008 RepID=A0AAD7EAG2_9AGAR|nr:hypothetical protein DFH08DRAFT_824914 [Mycena albidolilacea]